MPTEQHSPPPASRDEPEDSEAPVRNTFGRKPIVGRPQVMEPQVPSSAFALR